MNCCLKGLIVSILICLLIGLVAGSSLTLIVYEQSDRTAPVPEALVYTNGIISGKTNLDGSYNFSMEGVPPSIRVAKAGFSDWTGTPLENDTLVLVPLTIRNACYIVEVLDGDTLLPISDATVEAVGIDQEKIVNVTDGSGKTMLPLKTEQVYNLQITAPLYQIERDTIVTGFENLTGQYSLVKNDRLSVRVADSADVSPIPDAMVTIDGIGVGKTNERGILITSLNRDGEHKIEISAAGYDSESIAKRIGAEELLIDFLLNRQHTTIFISVFDSSRLPIAGVNVTIDGISKGVTNEYGRLMISNLDMVDYSVSLSKDGYETAIQTVKPDSETGEVTVELTQQKMSTLITVVDERAVSIQNASVSLDGVQSGSTNANGTFFIRITSGSEGVVTAEKDGYMQNSTVINSETKNATIILTRDKAAMTSGGGIPFVFVIIGGLAIVCLIIGIAIRVGRSKSGRHRRNHSRKRSL